MSGSLCGSSYDMADGGPGPVFSRDREVTMREGAVGFPVSHGFSTIPDTFQVCGERLYGMYGVGLGPSCVASSGWAIRRSGCRP